MGKYYEDELIPTSAQQVDRAYPEWALSITRLKIHAAKAIAVSDRLDADGLRAILFRLESEGPEPCFEAATKQAAERAAFLRRDLVRTMTMGYRFGAGLERLA